MNKWSSVELWVGGLISAALSGGAGAVILKVADPKNFHDWHVLGEAAGVLALVGVANYVQKSPLFNALIATPAKGSPDVEVTAAAKPGGTNAS